MEKRIETALIIFLILAIIVGGFLFIKKIKLPSQPISTTTPITFPQITTTTLTTTPAIPVFTPVSTSSETPSSLGKITKFKTVEYKSLSQYYILVPKDGVKAGTKIYMPFNGYVMYYKEDQATLNFQIYSVDKKMILTLLGTLKALCKVTKTEKADVLEGKVYYCNNLKQGDLIAETTQPLAHQDIALQMTGFLNEKSSLDMLYKYLPLMTK